MRSDSNANAECGRGLSDNQTEIHEPSRPILETCPGRAETSVPDLQASVVRHCSPTLAGLKCGSMFRAGSDLDGIRDQFVELTAVLEHTGVRIEIIRELPGSLLLYVYRPALLEAVFAQEDVMEFMERYGYTMGSAASMVSQLTERFVLCPTMPPEVGVFLDYPLEDVKGYIENEGRCCRCIGCWKVYGDVEKAEARFRSFKMCRDAYGRMFESGYGIGDLVVRI